MTLRELIRSDLARFTQTFVLRGTTVLEAPGLLGKSDLQGRLPGGLLYRFSHGCINEVGLICRGFFLA